MGHKISAKRIKTGESKGKLVVLPCRRMQSAQLGDSKKCRQLQLGCAALQLIGFLN
jgi:hypothetical protein